MLTEKDYCDYETSRELKELGFIAGLGEGDCGYCLYDDAWHDQVDRPLLYEAQKWLREEKEVYVTVIPEYNDYRPIKGVKYRLEVAYWKDDEFGYETIEWLDEECLHTIITFNSYEEALSEGIKEAVKILKEK